MILPKLWFLHLPCPRSFPQGTTFDTHELYFCLVFFLTTALEIYRNYIDCVFPNKLVHLLRIRTSGFFYMQYIQYLWQSQYILFQKHSLTDNLEAPIRALLLFFPHSNSYTLPHRTSTWDHLEILSKSVSNFL